MTFRDLERAGNERGDSGEFLKATNRFAKTIVFCEDIVVDQTIRSATELEQIVGRGTRVREDHGKLYFTILDFRKATEHFADPDFDGQPVQIYVPKPGESPVPPDDPGPPAASPKRLALSSNSAIPTKEGLKQLDGYLDQLGLARGVLVIFDRRREAKGIQKKARFEEPRTPKGRAITLLRARAAPRRGAAGREASEPLAPLLQ